MSFAGLQSESNPGIKSVKLEPQHDGDLVPLEDCQELLKSKSSCQGESDERQSSNVLSSAQSGTSMLDPGQSPLEDTGLSSISNICQAPLCRQFWKSGEYSDGKSKKVSVQRGTNYLHVHPMFLHSNATSHKWAFGAVAELLDNAVDEIENGATFVIVDKTSNLKDGSPALLIQDDGGGMDPDKIRECMSFGFSDKQSKATIGRYGNGFKTSSMRLGADVIVFSCHQNDKLLTKSVGLLSYTFLMRTGYDRIVVPMVDYESNASTGKLEISSRYNKEQFASNLSLLLQWSPYSTEEDLLKQFDDIGSHGTKVIIYNLWCNDEGDVELDFDSDPKDVLLSGEIRKLQKKVNVEHVANRLHYSLRVYLSILYLRIPESFKIILRGEVVEHHNIADDLKFYEYILYKPQSGRTKEGEVVTTIGFLKEAPLVNIHGFNVYHKNRLILPFWPVVNYADSRGRGVVGVLEANFIEPTHNKQDFERTSLFQKLENRLKEMTWEYWDYHCGLIGYQVKKKPREPVPSVAPSHNVPHIAVQKPVMLGPNSPSMGSINMNGASSGAYKSRYAPGSRVKRKDSGPVEMERTKRHLSVDNQIIQEPVQIMGGSSTMDQEATMWIQEHQKLDAKCLEYEKSEKELKDKLLRLNMELKVAQHEYKRLLSEVQLLGQVKQENLPIPQT